MREIQDLCDYIEEEICDAEKYAKKALEFKETNPTKAELMYKLATEELGHMIALHTEVVAEIKAYRDKVGEPPEYMLKLYEIQHKKHIMNAATVKGMLSLYKGDK